MDGSAVHSRPHIVWTAAANLATSGGGKGDGAQRRRHVRARSLIRLVSSLIWL